MWAIVNNLFLSQTAEIAVQQSGQLVTDFLDRHARGDRGDALTEAEQRLNTLADLCNEPVLSAYRLNNGEILWIYTNRNLNYTSVRLASEED